MERQLRRWSRYCISGRFRYGDTVYALLIHVVNMSSLGILLWSQLLSFVIRTINVKISSGNILTLSTNHLFTCNPFFQYKKFNFYFFQLSMFLGCKWIGPIFQHYMNMSNSNLEPPPPPPRPIKLVVNNYNFQNSICGSRFQRRVCSFPHLRNHYILYGSNNTYCKRKQWQ